MFNRQSTVIHVERPNYNKPWIQLSSNPHQALEKLVTIMAQSPKGALLLKQAHAKAHRERTTLSNILQPGEKSFTDITLMRKFSKHAPKEIRYKSYLRVFINHNLNIRDAVMDMAHELVHYTFRNTFNPYKKNFNLKNFIVSTLEGKGGEVDAYMMECEVFFELFHKSYQNKTPCHLTLDPHTQKMDRTRATKLFYRLGEHYHPFLNKIQKHNIGGSFLQHISPRHTLLLSATHDVPYPVAAIYEYETILKKTCENEFKRINILPKREVSSLMTEDYRKRCQSTF